MSKYRKKIRRLSEIRNKYQINRYKVRTNLESNVDLLLCVLSCVTFREVLH